MSDELLPLRYLRRSKYKRSSTSNLLTMCPLARIISESMVYQVYVEGNVAASGCDRQTVATCHLLCCTSSVLLPYVRSGCGSHDYPAQASARSPHLQTSSLPYLLYLVAGYY
jgi:hypothetical protein